MAETSSIEWTDATWNPVSGCQRVSPGCAHCYAETLAGRFPASFGSWGPTGTRRVASEHAWGDPARWARRHLRRVQAGQAEARPLRIFVASMGDIFEAHPVVEQVRARIWRETLPELGALRLPDGRPAAVLLALTKRADVARRWYDAHGCPDVVWPGVTVEDQQRADERIPVMLGLPRLWLSVEPLLGPVTLQGLAPGESMQADPYREWLTIEGPADYPYRERGGISWVIVGGESGPKARPMHPDWARSLRDQAQSAGVPFLFKQWGEWQEGSTLGVRPEIERIILSDGRTGRGVDDFDAETRGRWGSHRPAMIAKVGKHAAGRILDGRTWDEVPRG